MEETSEPQTMHLSPSAHIRLELGKDSGRTSEVILAQLSQGDYYILGSPGHLLALTQRSSPETMQMTLLTTLKEKHSKAVT